MSANAFAQRAANVTNNANKPTPWAHINRPPPAGHRPSIERHADELLFRTLAEVRTAADDTALEVDHMILDYLAYQATIACLASRDVESQRDTSQDAPNVCYISLANNLAMTDSFIPIFQARHPVYEWDDDIRFRLRLLQFTVLFSQRLTRNPSTPSAEALETLRTSNERRVRRWIGDEQTKEARRPSRAFESSRLVVEPAPSLSKQDLEMNRAQVLFDLEVPAEQDPDLDDAETEFYGTPSSLSLLDLLPLFMEVSADLNALLDRLPSVGWMQLAAEFMLQASLEAYLVNGKSGTQPIDEAFAWGRAHEGEEAIEQVEQSNIEMMFASSIQGEKGDLWPEIKQAQLRRLLSTDGKAGEDFATHLAQLSRQSPIAPFDARIRGYLSALCRSVPLPVLAQREQGELDGMSRQDTKKFFDSHER